MIQQQPKKQGIKAPITVQINKQQQQKYKKSSSVHIGLRSYKQEKKKKKLDESTAQQTIRQETQVAGKKMNNFGHF